MYFKVAKFKVLCTLRSDCGQTRVTPNGYFKPYGRNNATRTHTQHAKPRVSTCDSEHLAGRLDTTSRVRTAVSVFSVTFFAPTIRHQDTHSCA